MKIRIVGIKETSPAVWRLTFDGAVLGDSRGYDRDEAIAKARSFVRTNGIDGDWQGSEWVEFRNVLDGDLT